MKKMNLMALLMASILMLTACQAPAEPIAPTQKPVIITDAPTETPVEDPVEIPAEIPSNVLIETPEQQPALMDETQQDAAGEEDEVEYIDMAGTITEIADGYLLMQTPDGMMVQVNLSEETIFELDAEGELSKGAYIHVLFNGQMTRSLPAQIAAIKVGCYSRTGIISAVEEGRFTLTTALGEEIWVNTLPGQMAVNQETDEQVALTDGAKMTVYFNGAMTMSLPAQIGAELIVVVPETVVETISEPMENAAE